MDYDDGDTREQVTGQLNLPSVELKSVLRPCYHVKHMKYGGSNKLSVVGRASRLRGAGEQSGVAAECVDPGGNNRQKFQLREFHTV